MYCTSLIRDKCWGSSKSALLATTEQTPNHKNRESNLRLRLAERENYDVAQATILGRLHISAGWEF